MSARKEQQLLVDSQGVLLNVRSSNEVTCGEAKWRPAKAKKKPKPMSAAQWRYLCENQTPSSLGLG
jgi:hypothetical protein